MKEIEQIQKPIQSFLDEYDALVTKALKSDDPHLNKICDYVLSNQGKRLRPMLAILSAALHGTPNSQVYNSAFLLEIVHTSSLIHDDVVDESYVRRGRPSLNALWDSRTAVLVGDYLLSRALCHSLDNQLASQASMICRAIYSASEGELSQSRKSQTLNMDQQSYFDIIHKKTAVLFGAAAATGAYSCGANPNVVMNMQTLGEHIGVAFQIKDDILDYTSSEAQIGKPSCCDLREKKITLPLLHILEKADDKRRAHLLDCLSLVDSAPENIEYLRNEVIRGGGIEYAQSVQNDYCAKASALLDGYDESPFKTAMLEYIGLNFAQKK